MAAEPRRHVDVVAGADAELPLPLQRELWKLVDALWDVDEDGAALADAVARFAFDNELLIVPATPAYAAEGLRFYPVTPYTVKPVWLVRPAPSSSLPSAPAERAPTLRALGAEPIDGARG